MPQEYTLVQFKASDFKDQFGNTWCDAVFQEYSAPVKWVVKDINKVTIDEKYYGEITKETSKAGKEYFRFRSKQRPDAPQSSQGGSKGFKPQDTYSMYLAYSKDIVVALEQTSGYNDKRFNELLEAVTYGADVLYGSRPEAKTEKDKENVDKIFPVDETQQINLDDIPF